MYQDEELLAAWPCLFGFLVFLPAPPASLKRAQGIPNVIYTTRSVVVLFTAVPPLVFVDFIVVQVYSSSPKQPT